MAGVTQSDLIFGRSKSNKGKEYLRLSHILRVFATKEKTVAALFFPVVIARNKATCLRATHRQAKQPCHRQNACDTLKKLRLLRYALVFYDDGEENTCDDGEEISMAMTFLLLSLRGRRPRQSRCLCHLLIKEKT